jgi:type IV pilus assembly protein PilM
MKQAVLILDIGAALTNFIIVDNGVLEYTSSMPIAGNAFTESIARSVGTDAEKLKKELGLNTETKRGNIRQAVLPLLDNLVDEIKNVVRFHEDHSYSKKPVTKVMLCGGSSRLSGIADYISARLNLGAGKPLGRVVLADPWINSRSGSMKDQTLTREQALGFTTAIGLAQRGVDVV